MNFTEDIKAAMKAKDTVRLKAIRTLKSEAENMLHSLPKETDSFVTIEELLPKVLAKQTKVLNKSIAKMGEDHPVSKEYKELIEAMTTYVGQKVGN